jgi:hypothetical protein
MILPALMYLVCAGESGNRYMWNQDLILHSVFGLLAELYCVSPWFEDRSQTIRTVFFGATVALNAFASVAIAYKVLVIMRDASQSSQHNRSTENRARTVLVVIIESGAVYTVVGVVLAVYFCSREPAAIVLGSLFQTLSVRWLSIKLSKNTNSQLQFLNPAFIILRVAMGISYEYEASQSVPRSTITDLEKALPPLPLSKSLRGSMASFTSLDEKQGVIMVARKVDISLDR